MNKETVKARIEQIGIIPAIRFSSAEDALFAVEAVANSGIPIAEVTMTTPGALDVISRLARDKPDKHLVLVGRVSAFLILLIATLLAIAFTRQKLGVFDLIQDVGAWVAAPISVVFLAGILWRRSPPHTPRCRPCGA